MLYQSYIISNLSANPNEILTYRPTLGAAQLSDILHQVCATWSVQDFVLQWCNKGGELQYYTLLARKCAVYFTALHSVLRIAPSMDRVHVYKSIL